MSVFIEPQGESASRLLSRSLGAGLGQGLQAGMNQMFEMKQNKQSASSLADMLQITDKDKDAFVNAFANVPTSQQIGQAQQLAQIQAQMNKQEVDEKQSMRNQLNWLDENVGVVGFPLGSAESRNAIFPWQEGYQTKKQFDTTGFLTADAVYVKANKGQISEAKLKLITDQLAPNSKYSERENKARIEALRMASDLGPRLTAKELDKMVSKVKKVDDEEKGKTIAPRPPLEDIFK